MHTDENEIYEQLSIFDLERPDEFEKYYSVFHEHCKHRGWHKKATDTEPAMWMCSYKNKKDAKCWEDWQPCTSKNCSLKE